MLGSLQQQFTKKARTTIPGKQERCSSDCLEHESGIVESKERDLGFAEKHILSFPFHTLSSFYTLLHIYTGIAILVSAHTNQVTI